MGVDPVSSVMLGVLGCQAHEKLYLERFLGEDVPPGTRNTETCEAITVAKSGRRLSRPENSISSTHLEVMNDVGVVIGLNVVAA